MASNSIVFEAGNKVRFRPNYGAHCSDLPANGIYLVGAVAPLPNPNGHYVNKKYWDRPEWQWARGKTRLDVAGHPQVVFLEDFPELETGLPSYPPDPDDKHRRAFSGAYFELA